MSENRYSMRVCSQYSGINQKTVWYRAKKLGMDTNAGLTAAQLKAIIAYGGKMTRWNSGSLEELRMEMEGLR